MADDVIGIEGTPTRRRVRHSPHPVRDQRNDRLWIHTSDVYDTHMRTNIVLDDSLVREAMALTGERTKRAVVERGLAALVRLERLRRVRSGRGKLVWRGDLDRMRERTR